MATEKPKVSNTLVNFYALANGMNTIAFGVPTLYLTMFMTDYLGISPVAIGTGMLIAKTIDFIVSLISAIVIEKAHLKHGKFVSWIRIATVTCFFGNIVQMLDTTAFIHSPTLRLIIVMVFYIMFHSTMNFYATSRASLIPKLAGADMTARVRLTARQSQVGAAVSIISSAITLPLVQLIERITGSPSAGYFIAALIFSTLFAICNSIFAKLAAPFDPPGETGPARARPTIGQMVSSVVTNKQMLLLFVAFTITGIGNQLVAGITTYFFRVTGNFSKYTYVLTARSITALVFSMFAPAIGKKLGKKNALIAAWSLNIVINLCAWLFAYRNGEANIIIMAIVMCGHPVPVHGVHRQLLAGLRRVRLLHHRRGQPDHGYGRHELAHQDLHGSRRLPGCLCPGLDRLQSALRRPWRSGLLRSHGALHDLHRPDPCCLHRHLRGAGRPVLQADRRAGRHVRQGQRRARGSCQSRRTELSVRLDCSTFRVKHNGKQPVPRERYRLFLRPEMFFQPSHRRRSGGNT